MVTVFRAHGFHVVIFVDDHLPAHVHVFGDGHAKINLVGRNGEPEMVWVQSMKRSDVRRAMKLVVEQHAHLLERWRHIHG